jgi:hypothetical protein
LAAPCAVYLDAVTNIKKLIGERRLKTSDSLIIGYTASCTLKVGGDKILLPKLGYKRSSGTPTNDDYMQDISPVYQSIIALILIAYKLLMNQYA